MTVSPGAAVMLAGGAPKLKPEAAVVVAAAGWAAGAPKENEPAPPGAEDPVPKLNDIGENAATVAET